MTAPQYTQGPWFVGGVANNAIMREGSDGLPSLVATVRKACDAPIIAAAPDMAEALRQIAAAHNATQHAGMAGLKAIARAALAKAGV